MKSRENPTEVFPANIPFLVGGRKFCIFFVNIIHKQDKRLYRLSCFRFNGQERICSWPFCFFRLTLQIQSLKFFKCHIELYVELIITPQLDTDDLIHQLVQLFNAIPGLPVTFAGVPDIVVALIPRSGFAYNGSVLEEFMVSFPSVCASSGYMRYRDRYTSLHRWH